MYVVLEGNASVRYGSETVSLDKEDYLYLPSTIPHTLSNRSGSPLTVVVMGFRTQGFEKTQPPPHPLKANIEDVPTGLVNGHPSSALYRLLMGDTDSKRDRLAAGRVLTSLFLMEIAPGGTNFPHHHEREEEIYLVLSGHGVMVAGGGMTASKEDILPRQGMLISSASTARWDTTVPPTLNHVFLPCARGIRVCSKRVRNTDQTGSSTA